MGKRRTVIVGSEEELGAPIPMHHGKPKPKKEKKKKKEEKEVRELKEVKKVEEVKEVEEAGEEKILEEVKEKKEIKEIKEKEKEKPAILKKIKKRSKRYLELAKLIEKGKEYELPEALFLIKKISNSRFDETCEIHINLAYNPKKPDQIVKGTVTLPYSSGKRKKIIVFGKGEKELKEAGADLVGTDELIKKVEKGFSDFDVAIATPDMMEKIAPLGKILGPKGLMPSPKRGTVTDNPAKAIKEIKSGKIEFKMDKDGNIHQAIGKTSFDIPKLEKNIKIFLGAVLEARPSSLKGTYIKSITLTSSMGPGIKLNISSLLSSLKE